jgi:hypothetical protein
MPSIEAQLRQFVVKDFLFGERNFADTSLLTQGIMQSRGTTQLISFLESSIEARSQETELVQENVV